MSERIVRLGIVGTGKISHQLAEAVRLSAGFRLCAVYSRAQESGRAFADEWGIPLAVTDYARMLRLQELDAVYIASPNALHFEQAMAALGAGKHVLLEKPAVTTLADGQRLYGEARSRSLVCLEAMRPLHDPMLGLIRRTLPLLGRLRRVDLEYCQYSSRYDRFLRGETPNAFYPALGNAACMDIGVYPVAVLVALFGMPRGISARSLFVRGGFEAAGEVVCEYTEMLASVSYSKISDSVSPSVITGEMGSLSIDRLPSPAALTLHPRGASPVRLDYTPAPNNMVHELRDFHSMICGNPPCCPFSEYTLRQLRFLDEVRRQSGISFSAE